MLFAIIEESGGQRRVAEGDEILIDLYNAGESSQGDSITFDRVLLVGEPGSEDARVGQPHVDGASVSAEIIEPVVMGDKMHIYKFKRRKGYKRKTGHRQRYTAVRITGISA